MVVNIVIVSEVQQSDLVIHIYVFSYIFCKLSSTIVSYKILDTVSSTNSKSFFILYVVVYALILPIYPSQPSPLLTTSLFSMSESISKYFVNKFTCSIFRLYT